MNSVKVAGAVRAGVFRNVQTDTGVRDLTQEIFAPANQGPYEWENIDSPTIPKSSHGGLYATLDADNREGGWYNMHSVVNDIPPEKANNPTMGSDTLGLNVIQKGLGGSQPVLVYRMKPKQFVALNHIEATKLLRSRVGQHSHLYWRLLAKPTISEKAGFNQWVITIPHQSAHEITHWYDYDASKVKSFQVSYNDGDRVNGVYVKPPEMAKSQMELHGMLGEPMIQNRDVVKHGLRLHDPDYPFFPTGMADQTFLNSNMAVLINVLNEEMFCQYSSNDEQGFFGSGSVEIEYCPWIKAGHWCGGAFPESHKVDNPIAYSADLEKDERLDRVRSAEPGWAGYIKEVRHTVRVDTKSGRVAASTRLTLSDVSIIGRTVYQYTVPMVISHAMITRREAGNLKFLPDGSMQPGTISRNPDTGNWVFEPTEGKDTYYVFSKANFTGGNP